MATVYILYSQKIDRFYIGSCLNFEERLNEHNQGKYNKSYTAKTDEWILFYRLDELNADTARKIEQHVKRMKSKNYIFNFKKYPEISEKLIERYAGSSR